MASMRDIKRRIRSIESTQQITNAMKLVSTAKLQKAKARVEASRPFFEITRKTIASIVKNTTELESPLLKEREIENAAYVVITSDRGLAGGYNANVCKLAYEHMKSNNGGTVFAVGKKAKDYFAKKNIPITDSYTEITDDPKYSHGEKVGNTLIDMYLNEEIDAVYVAYTHFHSTIRHEAQVIKLLPFKAEAFEEEFDEEEVELDEIPKEVMNYEPSAEVVLNQILPQYMYSIIYGALVESAASEQGARMSAMDSATNNASDMISKLTLKYNRARQASITQEISEIVGGAEALK